MIRIDVTPRAARKVRSMVADRQPVRRHGLRVVVEPGTHPEPQYRLSLSPMPREDDVVLPRNGFDLFLPAEEAEQLDGVRIDFVESDTEAGFIVDRVPAPRRPGMDSAPVPTEPGDPEVLRRVREALAQVRPALNSDGGDVDLVAVADGAAYVRLEGACSGCSSAMSTLTGLIEATVVAAVPEVSRTVLVA